VVWKWCPCHSRYTLVRSDVYSCQSAHQEIAADRVNLRFSTTILTLTDVHIEFNRTEVPLVAQQVNVMLVDDIDGSAASETVVFALDGRQYQIDLSEKHAQDLREAMAAFVAAARRGAGRRSSAPAVARPATDRGKMTAIREWAKANGQSISDRGRISKAVMEAYANRDNVAAADKAAPKKPRKRSAKASA
jgi:hypothetical protein